MHGLDADSGKVKVGQASLLNAMNLFWDDTFNTVLGRSERAIVNELLEVRNKLAHNESFSYDDTERALDSMQRMLESIGSAPMPEIRNSRLLR